MPKSILYPYTAVNANCQVKTPVYLMGLGMSLLKQHFSNPDRLSLDKATFLYTEDETLSESNLHIGYRDNLDFKNVGKRPAIIVDLGDHAFPKEVVGDVIGHSPEQGALFFQDRTITSWMFNCISDKPLEAWSLAGEVKFFFQTYRRFIARAYCMDEIRVSALAGYQRFEEYKEMSGVRVIVGLNYQQSFGVATESLKVSAIDLELALADMP